MSALDQTPASATSFHLPARPNHGPQHPRRSRRDPKLTASERLELNRLASLDNPDEITRLRAQIILSWAAGATGEQSAKLLATSRRTVSKWRVRFRTDGIDGLVDRPRPGAPRSIDDAKIAELLRLQSSPPPRGRSRWTTRLLAEHTGLSQSTVVRLVRATEASSR